MCGLIGVIRKNVKQLTQADKDKFKQQNNIITHRGPDDEGYYHDEHVSFGFRRLSIIDIEAGVQPLSYDDENIWMVFNGEIYNYVELREDLLKKGSEFKTESDTEVIAAMYHTYGEEAFKELRGMFSILIWDKQKKIFYGARDPFGIKPLFYKETDEEIFFASEKKSITLLEESDTVDTESLQQYLSYQYVPDPFSMTEGIKKVEPGHYFVKREGEPIEFHRYWHATFSPKIMDKQAWIKRIQDVLYDSVSKHMRSDVPVGSFLSGGIDSSVIVAIAKEFNPNLKTFSVGFEREGYSEVDVAKETAEKSAWKTILTSSRRKNTLRSFRRSCGIWMIH